MRFHQARGYTHSCVDVFVSALGIEWRYYYLPKGAGGVLGDGHITMLASVTVTAVGDGHIRITGLNRHCLRYPYHFRDILPVKMVTPWYYHCRSDPYGRQ